MCCRFRSLQPDARGPQLHQLLVFLQTHRQLANDMLLWRRLCVNHFNVPLDICPHDWKELYMCVAGTCHQGCLRVGGKEGACTAWAWAGDLRTRRPCGPCRAVSPCPAQI